MRRQRRTRVSATRRGRLMSDWLLMMAVIMVGTAFIVFLALAMRRFA